MLSILSRLARPADAAAQPQTTRLRHGWSGSSPRPDRRHARARRPPPATAWRSAARRAPHRDPRQLVRRRRSINQSSQQKFVQRPSRSRAPSRHLVLQMVNERPSSRATSHQQQSRPPAPHRGASGCPTTSARSRNWVGRAHARPRACPRPTPDRGARPLLRPADRARLVGSRGPTDRRQARAAIGKALFDAFRQTAGSMLAEADRVVTDARHSQNSRYLTLLVLLARVRRCRARHRHRPDRPHPETDARPPARAGVRARGGELLLQREQQAHGEVEALVGRLQQSLLPVVDVPDPRWTSRRSTGRASSGSISAATSTTACSSRTDASRFLSATSPATAPTRRRSARACAQPGAASPSARPSTATCSAASRPSSSAKGRTKAPSRRWPTA